jgi:hypothetical protein
MLAGVLLERKVGGKDYTHTRFSAGAPFYTVDVKEKGRKTRCCTEEFRELQHTSFQSGARGGNKQMKKIGPTTEKVSYTRQRSNFKF